MKVIETSTDRFIPTNKKYFNDIYNKYLEADYLMVGEYQIKKILDDIQNITTLLQEKNSRLFLFRNIENDPKYYQEGTPQYESINKYPCIKTIPDYSILIMEDGPALCVGGGISLNRIAKKHYEKIYSTQTYWEDEETIYNPKILKEIKDTYDISSIFFYGLPTELDYLDPSQIQIKSDPEILEKYLKQRDILQDIYNLFKNPDKEIKIISSILKE